MGKVSQLKLPKGIKVGKAKGAKSSVSLPVPLGMAATSGSSTESSTPAILLSGGIVASEVSSATIPPLSSIAGVDASVEEPDVALAPAMPSLGIIPKTLVEFWSTGFCRPTETTLPVVEPVDVRTVVGVSRTGVTLTATVSIEGMARSEFSRSRAVPKNGA